MKGLSLASQPPDSMNKSIKSLSENDGRSILARSRLLTDAMTDLPLEHLTPLLHTITNKHRELIMDDMHLSDDLLRDFVLLSSTRKMRNLESLEREISSIEEDVGWVDKRVMELGLARALAPIRHAQVHDSAGTKHVAWQMQRDCSGELQRIRLCTDNIDAKKSSASAGIVAGMLSTWGIDRYTYRANSRHDLHPAFGTQGSDSYSPIEVGAPRMPDSFSPAEHQRMFTSLETNSTLGKDGKVELETDRRIFGIALQGNNSDLRSIEENNVRSLGADRTSPTGFNPELSTTAMSSDDNPQTRVKINTPFLLPLSEAKIKKVFTHFSNLQQIYSKVRCSEDDSKAVLFGSSSIIDSGSVASHSLDHFTQLISDLSSCNRLHVVGQVKTVASSNSNAINAIISSIEVDKEDFCFATAGVSKRINLFRFCDVCDGYEHQRQPIHSISTACKLSCLSYSKHVQNHIASSDYEGVISVWDVETGVAFAEYEEHGKRAWTVDFCRTDPRLLASGSDDGRVKIWSTNQAASVLELDMRANVCCAQYGPTNAHQLAVGCADHRVHLFDLRNPSQPLYILSGHRKAVSYVRFLPSGHELVSASTDSTVCVWDINRACQIAEHGNQDFDGNSSGSKLTRIHDGHVNEKNFVGLSVGTDEYIACGSETNEVIVYHKELRRPLLRYDFADEQKFPVPHSCSARHSGTNTFDNQTRSDMGFGASNLEIIDREAGTTNQQQSQTHFISATCWKGNDATLLAASSNGLIRVLQLVN